MRHFDPDIWREVTGGAVAERVRRLARVTPLVQAPPLSRSTGADVWLKLESLQRTGSFKLRGAAARLAAMAAAGQTRVIVASAGSHGLGVAYAARAFGLEATVLVSSRTPAVKAAASPPSARPSRWWAAPTTRPKPRRAGGPPRIRPGPSSRPSTTTT